MTTIRLHNTQTRAKEDFAPIDPANVRMYVCGPTVYDRAHLGNARPVVVFDVLFRLLRHVYGADHVTYVRNFTDVDDKINAEALRRQKAGAPRHAGRADPRAHRGNHRAGITRTWTPSARCAPRIEPRATEYIGPMIAMIRRPDRQGPCLCGRRACAVRACAATPTMASCRAARSTT